MRAISEVRAVVTAEDVLRGIAYLVGVHPVTDDAFHRDVSYLMSKVGAPKSLDDDWSFKRVPD